jgi:hypothetical protein
MDSMSDSRFKVHFRMIKDTFRSIALKVCPLLDTNWEENPGPNRPITSAYKLLAVLWRFARGEAFKCLAAVFNLSTAAINQAVILVTKAIIEAYSPIYLTPPTTAQQRLMAVTFRRRGAIPNVIGAVDGSYIFINKPTGGVER